ncbi:hypothetical protein NPIL_299421 [Nephila pilipes]|uniref:Uncharacterized protein n=1 Tax=Nephila pilipes TaxID=299642 RepID=A0A8X6JPP5_NEPPI|nr:hypothetical protein NPIL_299421 [Nephila pilipes]
METSVTHEILSGAIVKRCRCSPAPAFFGGGRGAENNEDLFSIITCHLHRNPGGTFRVQVSLRFRNINGDYAFKMSQLAGESFAYFQ